MHRRPASTSPPATANRPSASHDPSIHGKKIHPTEEEIFSGSAEEHRPKKRRIPVRQKTTSSYSPLTADYSPNHSIHQFVWAPDENGLLFEAVPKASVTRETMDDRLVSEPIDSVRSKCAVPAPPAFDPGGARRLRSHRRRKQRWSVTMEYFAA
jgi:hypothetical protein